MDMTTSATERVSSSDVRDAILFQHEGLRTRLAETIDVAERAAHEELSIETLRAEARKLYEELAAHMAFEAQMLPAALRDVIGWGAVLQARMTAEQERRQAMLAVASSALATEGVSAAELAAGVRSFVSTILFDLEVEETGFLQADVDSISVDSHGG